MVRRGDVCFQRAFWEAVGFVDIRRCVLMDEKKKLHFDVWGRVTVFVLGA